MSVADLSVDIIYHVFCSNLECCNVGTKKCDNKFGKTKMKIIRKSVGIAKLYSSSFQWSFRRETAVIHNTLHGWSVHIWKVEIDQVCN